MSGGEVFIFFNPIAGRGRGQAMADRIARSLTQAGIRVRSFGKHTSSIADQDLISEKPPLAAVAIGGDGTLRSVAERWLEFTNGDASRIPPLLVVPLGTANLMSRHLGLNWDSARLDQQATRLLLNRRISLLDTARANNRLFLLMAGVGIDAAVVHEMERLRRGPIDFTSYAMPAALALTNYDYPPLHVEVDGRCVWENQQAMAFIGNAREYGTGFPILTEAKSDDGLLDVCVLPCRSRVEVLHLMMAIATGDHLHQEGVVYTQGRSISVESTQSAPVQIDGEASGHTPVRIELLPSRLPFIVP